MRLSLASNVACMRLLVVALCCWQSACLKSSAGGSVHGQGGGQKPNIVVILADDLGINDVGWVNKQNVNDIRTPHLDALAAEGVKLTDFYTQHICGPSRAALLTGRYPIHLGLQHANLKSDQENGVPRNETTLAADLKKLGYATYGLGKWHLGHWHQGLIPTSRGFDHWYGFLHGSEDHFAHTDECGYSKGLDLWDNDKPDTAQRGVYSTHLFTAKAVHFIRQHAEQRTPSPFFMYLAYAAVHTPLQAPEEVLARWAHVQNTKRRKYAAMLSLLDEGVGNVSAALRDTGLQDRTVMVFLSDNGGQVKEGASNWPYRGWKGSLWEGGVRSQAFIHSPLLPPALVGASWSGLAHVVDIFPTMLQLAGGSAPRSVDGYDLWPSLVAGGESPRRELLLNIDPVRSCADEHSPNVLCDSEWGVGNAAIRVGEWKLIKGYPGDWPSHQDGWVAPAGWEPPPYKLRASSQPGCGACAFQKDDPDKSERVCLFNLHEDAEERCDLAGSRPDVVRRLLERLQVYNSSAVPVRYPKGAGRKCSPLRFGGIIQWWDTDEGPAKRVLPEEDSVDMGVAA